MIDFDDFWQAYPRRVARGQAEKAYAAALREVSHDEIMTGLARFSEWLEQQGKDKQFIPHAATWLRAKRWADEYTQPGPTYAEQMASLDAKKPNSAKRAQEIYENDLLPEIMRRWKETGWKHFWHVQARMRQARALAGFRAANEAGTLSRTDYLDHAEKQYATGRLPDAARQHADWQEKTFGDPSRRAEQPDTEEPEAVRNLAAG